MNNLLIGLVVFVVVFFMFGNKQPFKLPKFVNAKIVICGAVIFGVFFLFNRNGRNVEGLTTERTLIREALREKPELAAEMCFSLLKIYPNAGAKWCDACVDNLYSEECMGTDLADGGAGPESAPAPPSPGAGPDPAPPSAEPSIKSLLQNLKGPDPAPPSAEPSTRTLLQNLKNSKHVDISGYQVPGTLCPGAGQMPKMALGDVSDNIDIGTGLVWCWENQGCNIQDFGWCAGKMFDDSVPYGEPNVDPNVELKLKTLVCGRGLEKNNSLCEKVPVIANQKI